MEELFAALRGLVPGHDVLDVRFLTAQGEGAEGDVVDLDKKLADSLIGARPVDIGQLS